MVIYLAVMLDFLFGDPKKIPHPVVFIGKLISFYEKGFYRIGPKRWAGFLFTLAVLVSVSLPLLLIAYLASYHWLLAFLVNAYLLYTALAWRSLKKESGQVMAALAAGDIEEARVRLSYIVGRDTADLSEEEIIKATVETIGENTVDGIIAPLFYMMIGWFLGAPLLLAYLYKTVNTLDSMVGYRNERYQDFGFFAAKLDDVLNYLPARLGALLMLVAGGLGGGDIKAGWRVFRRDRYAHQSPNSAQSESVMAGLLGIQLGGSHHYFGELVTKPTIGEALKEADTGDYAMACRVMDGSVLLTLLLFTIPYLVVIL